MSARNLWDGFNDLNPPSSIRSVIKLMHIPHRSARMRRLELTVSLDETKRRGENTMRCVFTTELKVDIDTSDDPLRKAFIDFVLAKAREVYGSAAMLAKTPPVMSVSITSREGRQVLPVFGAPIRDTDEDDVD
jgi:hypothetical protein